MLLTLLIVLALIFLSAFFSGSETGLTAASKSRLHSLKQEGKRGAARVLMLKKQSDKLIGTILLGNNLVNILASALATSVGIYYFGAAGVAYATAIMTFLVLVFAEVLPKTFAIRYPERVALLVAPVFSALIFILRPFTFIIQCCVNAVLWLLRMDASAPGDEVEGTEVIRGAIAWHHDEGGVVKDNKDMLGGVLDLDDVDVTKIMLHRKQMQTLDADMEAELLIDAILTSNFTRLPVWQGNPDNIIGVLHAKDVLRAIKKQPDRFVLKEVIREPWFIPETTTLAEQLSAFKARKTHFALVVDEYGDIQGLVTLEDILEEIVGQIDDEHDTNKKRFHRRKDGSYVMEGSLPLRDINRELDWHLQDEEATTLAGYLIHHAGIIPNEGQIFQFQDFRFTVLKKERNQIVSVKVRQIQQEASSDVI